MTISLKTKILIIIGSLITILMMIISLGILYQWRSLIIVKLEQNTHAVTQAFSVPVLDALIHQENEARPIENFLENYISDFMQKNQRVAYIGVHTPDGAVIAHSDLSRYDHLPRTGVADEPAGIIYDNPDYGWIIESVLPLQIAGKRWGVLRMGFDADETRAEISRLFLMLFSLTIIVIISTLAVLYVLINNLTDSLQKLALTMDQVDFESSPPPELKVSNDEIGLLITHFQSMQQRLSQSKIELIKAQKQIFHAEKLASIGRLASGVAHEINNPLNGIKNCVYTIRREPDDQPQTAEYLELIDEGLTHIETVVQKLLGFARKQSPSAGPTNVNEVFHKMLALLNYKLDQSDVETDLQLSDNLPLLNIDPHLFEEVIMNLLLNAFDALPSNGQITIKTRQNDDNQVCITVADNGMGIPADELEVIFDPFYTTKEEGKGTGLGLSVSLGIIETHNGTLEVTSVPGKTEFEIVLPVENTG